MAGQRDLLHQEGKCVERTVVGNVQAGWQGNWNPRRM